MRPTWLIEAGVWEAIEDRLKALGSTENSLMTVRSELQWEERAEELKAVRGEEPVDAIAEYQAAIKLAPTQPGLHEELGSEYRNAGKPVEAEASFQRRCHRARA